MTLEQVISGLAQSLHSIDIRAAVKKSDSGWKSVLTAIRISARSIEDVKQRYAELQKRFGRRQTELLKVLVYVCPFTEFGNILNDLAEGKIMLEGEQIFLPTKLVSHRLEGRVERFQQFVRPWHQQDRASFYCFTGERSEVYHQRDVTAAVRGSLGLSSVEEMVDTFLEVRGSSNHILDLFILVEMPARIKSLTAVGQAVEIQVEAEGTLRDLHVVLSRYDSRGTTILEKKTLDLEELEQVGKHMVFALSRVKASLNSANKDDIISCLLTHENMPELDEVRARLKALMPLEEKNPLLESLRQFWDMENFYQQLERPYETAPKRVDVQPQDAFQKSVSRVLSLAGFHAIDLERDDRMYHPQTKVERATIDIVAYHPECKILLLGACTINVPKAEDYDKLLHATAILKGLFADESSVHLVPVLFSGQENVPTLREEAAAQGLRILNVHQITVLRKLVEKGEEERFVSFLQGWPWDGELRERSEWES
ncbi:MAG: hypothetical protein ACRDIC_25610 [bacterium]